VTRRGPILVGIAVALVLAASGAAANGVAGRRALVYQRNDHVIVAGVDGTHPRVLASGWAPKISPDGRWVAFTRCFGCTNGGDTGRVDLYVVAARGGTPRRLARRVDAVVWTPDSKTLVAEHHAGLLRAVQLDGHARVLAAGHTFGAHVSPDGRTVAYSRSTRTNGVCPSRADLYRVPIRGGSSRRLTRDASVGPAVWGPPGIAFAHETGRCGVRTVWFVRPDGSGLRALVPRLPRDLTRAGYYGLEPVAWLPTGQLLVAISAEFRQTGAILDPRTGRLMRLGLPIDTVSRDGRWIVGTASGAEYPWSIAIAPLAGGRPRTIARGQVCCADWNR
jgi:Tol biopolymer transport system component